MSAIAAVLVIFLLLLVIWLISYYSMKRKRKAYIHEKFGKIPKAKEWNDAVKNFCNVMGDGTGIDDITWNDLSMNEVFQRTAQCDSSAGEEILYWRMRRNRMSCEEQRTFEQCVRRWGDEEKERERIEEMLCDIGKSDASYYIPAYLDSIEAYILPFQWVYRMLQILLAVSFAGLLVFPGDWSVFPFVGMCAVNLALYVWFNLKHELELSLVGTAVSLLRNAKQIAGQKDVGDLFPELGKALGGLRGVIRGERIRASRAILEYLRDKNCIALVATHDKELTELLGNDYLNYHFSKEIGEEDISFSYKIMEGPATSQNGVKLLEFAGFPREIIEAAQEVCYGS